jgi:N-acetylglucosaminyldiphosphoundecaprenol N-acetyl-beta-D-mannosaminyltransferase
VGAVKDLGKRSVLGVLVDVVDYDGAVRRIIDAAKEGRPYGVSALAVHGVMTGVMDRHHRYRLNHLDLATADGQPVRWALNLLHGARLSDRVYGPTLTLKLCPLAAAEGLPLYLYGSSADVVDRLRSNLLDRFPGLSIAGAEPSKFRRTTPEEKADIAQRIRSSGAKITLVGLGCPRQEMFVHEFRDALRMPVVAVGAAFDYHAGVIKEPPMFVQGAGLHWLYRLAQQPRRLWKRYVLLNPAYAGLLVLQALRLWRPDPNDSEPPAHEIGWA